MTKRIGTPAQYAEVAALARTIRDTAEKMQSLTLELGEFGQRNECEATRAVFAQIAAISALRADEARLISGELSVPMNASEAIHEALSYWRETSTHGVVGMTPARAASLIRPEDRLASTVALALASQVISTIPDPDGRLHNGIMAAMNAVYETQKACCASKAPRPVLVDESPALDADGRMTPGILAELTGGGR